MFSGIIREIGTIRSVASQNEERDIVIACSEILSRLHPGSSVSVNGVCLTAQEVTRDSFSARLMPHTIAASTLGALKSMDRVNLETALQYGDELGGHLVYGHVDGIGEIRAIASGPDATLFTVALPEQLSKYIVKKGAIAIDGVSLTVAELTPPTPPYQGGDRRGSITISVVPFTLSRTIFGEYSVGTKVDVEVDMMAKHMEKLLDSHPGAALRGDRI